MMLRYTDPISRMWLWVRLGPLYVILERIGHKMVLACNSLTLLMHLFV